MGFIHPEFLWLFPLLIPLLLVWNVVRRRRAARMARFVAPETWPILNDQVSTRARFHRGILVILALSFSIIAAARPYWGVRERELVKRGVNVIYAVDVSQSMRAGDVEPSRLEHARTALRQVLVETPGNRVGILPFAGEAFLQCPLTTDYGIAQEVLGQISYDSVGFPGTNIPAAIKAASEAFDRSGGGIRLLVLLTDGENLSEEISDAADLAAEKGIRIYALGIGTPEGAPIRLADGSLKEARDGSKVLTQLNAQILRDLASRTGGRAYVAGSRGRIDPTPLVRDLQSIDTEELAAEKRIIREERYQWPLGLALLCFFIEGMIGDRRNSPHSIRGRRPAAKRGKEAVA